MLKIANRNHSVDFRLPYFFSVRRNAFQSAFDKLSVNNTVISVTNSVHIQCVSEAVDINSLAVVLFVFTKGAL